MRRFRFLYLVLALSLSPSMGFAGDVPPDSHGTPDPAEAAKVEKPRTAFGQRVADRMEQEKARLEELESDLKRAKGTPRGEEILAEIRLVKATTELDLMKIQLEFARESGKPELIEQIEAAIEAVKQRPVFQSQIPTNEGDNG